MRPIDADGFKMTIASGVRVYDGMCRVEDIAHSINNEPTINQWISVEERLPEPDTPVLVCVPDYSDTHRVLIARYDDLWGWIGQWDGAISMRTQITHWMPLPEPPKEETP